MSSGDLSSVDGVKISPDKEYYDLTLYIFKKVEEYALYKFRDDVLWEAFNDDFVRVTENNLSYISPNLLRVLRSHLRTHGVLVEWDRNLSVLQSIFQTITEKEPRIWTREEFENSNETFNSNKISHAS
ncbi:hypothetical protein GcC1_079023 [Golovinomyces cichoracearum]|uniref:Uncharacterized protein n=1 Tax=Golovinomyces cichoracearum TaxID=62708 RepID=A0A420IL45_9PEZI|nr:hypothetical protein GcC1_079023 [Golovinomyces cichoracearum]